MLKQHHMPQLTLSRVSSALNRLKSGIWAKRDALEVESTPAQQEQVSLKQAQKLPRQKIANFKSWGRLFDQRWCYIDIGEIVDDETWLFWIDQGEATLYVEGEVYFGFNIAHRRCRLPKGCKEVWLQSSCIQSAIWHEDAKPMQKGSYFEEAYLASRNEEMWHAWHDLQCLFDLAMDQRKRENPQAPTGIRGAGLQPLVSSHSPEFRLLLRLMEDAIDTLDTEGVGAFRAQLKKGYEKLKLDKSFSKAILTGHAHMDLVWLWPERMGELKAVNVFATANRLMDEYPEFRFAYSQPASYEAVERRENELFKRIQARIGEGRWQATGAMQVESDTLIACGEALARSFTVGQKGFEHITGKRSSLTWLPDVFGYSACLPQIMNQCGVDYFFTTKMTWNAINRFPYSSFIWRGNDGSEVLSHVMQDAGYVSHMEVERIKAPMYANQQADLHDEYLLPVGYGDGGGGVSDEMLERARRLNQLPTMPEIKWDHPEAFFKRLENKAGDLPVHQGECYLEYHRGTYTTHSDLKSSFRGLERALQIAEAAAVSAAKDWNKEAAWKKLIFAQFHDYIPGSSVWDVYIEGLPILKKAAEEQLNKVDECLNSKGEPCVFNPHALPLKMWLLTSQGHYQWVEMPPLAGSAIEDVILKDIPESPCIKGDTISNGLSSFSINEQGWITSLNWDKKDVPIAEPLAQLVLYRDIPAHYEAWDIDRHTLSLGEVCDDVPEITHFQNSHSAGYVIKRKIGRKSMSTLRLELQAGKPEILIDLILDWQEENHLLKLVFPTEYGGSHVRCGSPFGSVLRPQLPGKMEAEAMWEIPFSRHLSVFDDGESQGMSFLTESKYGASVRSGCVGISLVRSPVVTGFDRQLNHAWPSHLSQYSKECANSDLGEHRIKCALAPYHNYLPRERQPAALADTLFTKPILYTGKPTQALMHGIVGGESLVPHWVKPADKGGWVLRLHEVGGQRGSITLKVPGGMKLALTQIDEQKEKPIDVSSEIKYTPYQVVSIRVF
ncbi:MAG: alpha-mannosidase [Planctomycetes bacterium]|nr:alpha-mannosidase [Planctomycetota bacterium]